MRGLRHDHEATAGRLRCEGLPALRGSADRHDPFRGFACGSPPATRCRASGTAASDIGAMLEFGIADSAGCATWRPSGAVSVPEGRKLAAPGEPKANPETSGQRNDKAPKGRQKNRTQSISAGPAGAWSTHPRLSGGSLRSPPATRCRASGTAASDIGAMLEFGIADSAGCAFWRPSGAVSVPEGRQTETYAAGFIRSAGTRSGPGSTPARPDRCRKSARPSN